MLTLLYASIRLNMVTRGLQTALTRQQIRMQPLVTRIIKQNKTHCINYILICLDFMTLIHVPLLMKEKLPEKHVEKIVGCAGFTEQIMDYGITGILVWAGITGEVGDHHGALA